MEKNIYGLKPKYDSAKSFYRKAMVETDGNAKKLYSYDTLVASVKNGVGEVYNLQSKTTTRHVREFLLQEGCDAGTQKQIYQDYFVNK
jgi:hypothetical protein